MQAADPPLVRTIRERCRVCYTCVRECPAKAIRIVDRQAEVIPARCIGCGNCVRVCSQDAKRVASDMDYVLALLASGTPTAAIVAPSFPAEFSDIEPDVFVGMIRKLGFALVNEVSFGADLVAAAYRRLLSHNRANRWIGTTCPAIVAYVERYQPDLVPRLAPIVSPMVATARVLRRMHGGRVPIVFIGPCIAKKGEAASGAVVGEVSAVMTFAELRQLFEMRHVQPAGVEPREFDPPRGGAGGLFPVSRGMLQAAEIPEDLASGEVIATDGHHAFVEALREFAGGELDVQLLDCLCCPGCVMGPGMATKAPQFKRRALVGRHVRRQAARLDRLAWWQATSEFADLDLSRSYLVNDQRVQAPTEAELEQILERIGKHRPGDELNCGACGYETCRAHATAIFRGLAESEMCLPFTIEELRKACGELQLTNEQLATAQEALMQSEKLASMGQLAAGIAHEVNNPLGTVLMLAHILLDETGREHPYREDLEMMVGEADRCKKIVSGLLHFARKNKVEATEGPLHLMIAQSAHALRMPDNVRLEIEHDGSDTSAEFDRDQIVQVFQNLVSNAVAAMPGGGTLRLRTGSDAERVWLAVQDTGTGIPKDVLPKIFEPFFTTKPAGSGTGLGLSVTYGIVKMHSGDLLVDTQADPAAGPTGTTFTVRLPRRRRVVATETNGAPA